MSKRFTGMSSRNSGQKDCLKSIQEWIEVSFMRFDQVPTYEMLETNYFIHSNQDINRFLNDLLKEVILIVSLPIN